MEPASELSKTMSSGAEVSQTSSSSSRLVYSRNRVLSSGMISNLDGP